MKYLILAALPLLTSTPGLAQPPSDDPWTRTTTQAEAEARAKAIHAQLDLNHDGYVTVEEINQWAKQQTHPMGEFSPRAVDFERRLLLQEDADHDGRVSLAEALAGTNAKFAQMDTNHDGKVTPEEQRAAMAGIVDQTIKTWQASH